LEAVEGTSEGEEVAKLCVGKLRGMMVIEGDSNCKPKAIITIFAQISSFRSKIRCVTRF
jgi:AP-3 complex subunit delta-1